MKKIVSLLLCLAMLLLLLAACGPNDPNDPNDPVNFGSLSGEEVAKLLLSRERLDSETLLGSEGVLGIASASMQKASATIRRLSANETVIPLEEALEAFNDGAGDSTEPAFGFEMTDEKYIWNRFEPNANLASFFLSHIENIDSVVNNATDMIDSFRDRLGITDTWIGDEENRMLLEVDETSEMLIQATASDYMICLRTTDSQARNTYEIYQNSGDDIGTYIVYSPDGRYEYHRDTLSLIAENNRGYWNMYVVYSAGADGYNMQNLVMMEEVAYTIMGDLREGEPFHPHSFQILTPDLSCDILSISNEVVELVLNGFTGVDHVYLDRAEYPLGDNRLHMNLPGYAANDTGAVPTVVLKNGREIKPGDSFADGNLAYQLGYASADPNTCRTTITLSRQYTPASEEAVDVGTLLGYVNQFLTETGLVCRLNFDTVARNAKAVDLLYKEFANTYRFNGEPINTVASVTRGLEKQRAVFNPVFPNLYAATASLPTLSWEEALPPTLGGTNFAEVKGITAGSISYADGQITVKGLALDLGELMLLDEGSSYVVRLALARVDEAGGTVQTVSTRGGMTLLRTTKMLSTDDVTLNSVAVVPLTASAEETPVLFPAGSTAFAPTGSGTYTLATDLIDGKYTVVAYVCTADEHIRISEMIPLAYGEDLFETVTTDETEAILSTDEARTLRFAIMQKTEIIFALEWREAAYTSEEIYQALLQYAMNHGTVTDDKVEQYDATNDAWVAVDEGPTAGHAYRMAYERHLQTGETITVHVICEVPVYILDETPES